jgi:hypothetical protein
VITPRDIYGNIVLGVPDLKFEAELFDGLNTVKSKLDILVTIAGISRYNDVLRRYEIFITPINTNKEA